MARDWCGSGSNGTVVTEASRRGPWACSAGFVQKLLPGEHSFTAAWPDTDAFRVHGGCTMAVGGQRACNASSATAWAMTRRRSKAGSAMSTT